MLQRLGILGGGQLGQMMMPTIRAFGIDVSVLDPNPECSCANLADTFVQGDFSDYQTVLDFGQTVDIITIEIEHINVDALEELEKQGKKVFPKSATIRTIQNKFLQKEFFKTHHIPTSEFIKIPGKNSVHDYADFLPAAQKSCTGGYDGQGVKLLKTEADIPHALPGETFLEKLVDIDQELSVIVARNQNGDIQTFPTVGQDFDEKANLVKFVYAPAKIPEKINEECQTLAKKIAEKFDLVGILAIEFFLDTNGNILVNEVAPRAHNSGHWSIEGAITSQFEQLIRAIFNLPLGKTDIRQPSVMVNLLGAEGHTGIPKIKNSDLVFSTPDAHLHWYGKKITKPWRKMGHITICGKTLESAKENAEKIFQAVRVEAE